MLRITPTTTSFGLFLLIIIRPICCESDKPTCCQVFPLSEDFKIPIPGYEEREELLSPVPTQITDGLDC